MSHPHTSTSLQSHQTHRHHQRRNSSTINQEFASIATTSNIDFSATAKTLTSPNDSKKLLNAQSGRYKIYRKRWYILLIFSLLSFQQCFIWQTFGPIERSVRYAYPNWSEDTVVMMGNWGCITFLMFVIPLCWYMEKFGIRNATLIVSGLMSVATILRVFSTDPTPFTINAHICAILNGIAGITIMAAPPAVSGNF